MREILGFALSMTEKEGPQDDRKEALSLLQRHSERSEESRPARLRAERAPGVFIEGPASRREILRALPSG